MSEPKTVQRQTAPVTDEATAALAKMVGLDIPSDRLPAVAARLDELRQTAAVLRELRIDDDPPRAVFDPRWTEPP